MGCAIAGGGILVGGQPPPAWANEGEFDGSSPRTGGSSAPTTATTTTTSVAPRPDAPTTIPKQKPFAPMDQLLPAARVKWTIDRAVQIAATAAAASEDSSNIADCWNELDSLLLVPQNYTDNRLPALPTSPAKAYLDTYQRNRQQLPLGAQPGALLVQSGEIAAWKRLKQQERNREQEDEIRAALNLYTSSLSYSAETYLLNVPASERKQMIRQDRLPDIKQVIQSDMGIRYLIRNELLTYMQDVRAELQYQLNSRDKQPPSLEELLPLLQKAQDACNRWFDLIDESDVQEVMRLVEMEKGG